MDREMLTRLFADLRTRDACGAMSREVPTTTNAATKKARDTIVAWTTAASRHGVLRLRGD